MITVPTSSALLTIDTRDSYKFQDGFIAPNYTNPYNIEIYKNESIFQGKINRLALQEVNMIYSIPNVNPYNNALFLSGSTGPEISVTIPTSFYPPQELGKEVAKQLNETAFSGVTGALGCTGWNVSYDTGRGSFTIKNGDGITGPTGADTVFPFKINPKYGQDKGQVQNAGEPTVYTRTDTLATMMGFGNVANALTPTPGSTGIQQTGIQGDVASMLYTTYIDVVSQALTANQKVRDVSTNNNTGSNLLARIYISKDFQPLDTTTFTFPQGMTGPGGASEGFDITNNTLQVRPFYINYQPSYVKQVRWDDSIFLSSLNIRLQDDKGNLLYDFERNPTAEGGTTSIALSGSNAYAQLTFLMSEASD
jgi:hypothetical protein